MKNLKYIVFLSSLLVACQPHEDKADAYGHFETNEILLSSEMPGRIIDMRFNEGTEVEKGDTLAVIEHEQLRLQLRTLVAKSTAITAQVATLRAQKDVAQSEIQMLTTDLARISKLAKQGAATLRQEENLEMQLKTAQARLMTFDTRINAINKEVQVITAEQAVVNSQISRAYITSPIDGRVLQKFGFIGEVLGTGKPFAKIAHTKSMYLKAYLSGDQLSTISIGQEVNVLADGYQNDHKLTGVVSWVSDKAEFTPKVIQTKEERVNLVYAFKVRVTNPGFLKIGMPGEIRISEMISQ